MKKIVFSYISYIINQLGYSIAVLNIGGNYEYILYSTFDPSQSGGSATVDFCTIKGIPITEFITTATIDIRTNEAVFRQNFMNYVKDQDELHIKFNKVIEYMLFTL